MIPITVAIDGQEEHGGFLVYQLTETHAVVATPPEGRLAAFPLEACRVLNRYLDPGQAIWWNAIWTAGEQVRQDLAEHALVPGPGDGRGPNA